MIEILTGVSTVYHDEVRALFASLGEGVRDRGPGSGRRAGNRTLFEILKSGISDGRSGRFGIQILGVWMWKFCLR
jgi:hypothetical protein